MSFSLYHILLGNQYIGIENYSIDNENYFAFLLAEKKNKEIHIVSSEVGFKEETFPKEWSRSLPVFLVINNNQVIKKEVEGTEPNNEKLLHKAFPHLNRNDFYYEIWRLKSKSIVSVTRKNFVDELVSQYRQQGISIAGISLGVGAMSEIMLYTDAGVIETNTQIVSSDESSPVVNSKSNDLSVPYHINGLSIQSSHVMGFAGILCLIKPGDSLSGSIKNHNKNLLDLYYQRSFFRKGFKIMLGSLLFVLLLNFIAFNFYFKKAEQIHSGLVLNQFSSDQIADIKARIQKKEMKLKSFIDIGTSKVTPIINTIATKVPPSILLNELIYNPLDRKIKSNEPISVAEKAIILSGSTVNNQDFTHWIESLSHISQVKQVNIVNFGNDQANTTAFTIRIILR